MANPTRIPAFQHMIVKAPVLKFDLKKNPYNRVLHSYKKNSLLTLLDQSRTKLCTIEKEYLAIVFACESQ